MKIHNHFRLFFLGVNRSGPRWSSTTPYFTRPWDDFMVHDVNIPLGYQCHDEGLRSSLHNVQGVTRYIRKLQFSYAVTHELVGCSILRENYRYH